MGWMEGFFFLKKIKKSDLKKGVKFSALISENGKRIFFFLSSFDTLKSYIGNMEWMDGWIFTR